MLHPAAIRDVVLTAEAAGFTLVTFAGSPLRPGRPARSPDG
ncbi:hypothetical protein [Amycolatopsis australiensis]|nr:hypothetical protein [Amycolatopsis australiensis]